MEACESCHSRRVAPPLPAAAALQQTSYVQRSRTNDQRQNGIIVRIVGEFQHRQRQREQAANRGECFLSVTLAFSFTFSTDARTKGFEDNGDKTTSLAGQREYIVTNSTEPRSKLPARFGKLAGFVFRSPRVRTDAVIVLGVRDLCSSDFASVPVGMVREMSACVIVLFRREMLNNRHSVSDDNFADRRLRLFPRIPGKS